MKRTAVLLLSLGLAPPLSAADIEVSGLLVNETRTFAGQEFFSAFSSAWQVYDPDGRHTLVIRERPSARTGSQISVSTGANLLFQRFIGFNARVAGRAGRDASGQAYNALLAAELDRQLIDPDLGRDEIQ